MSEEPTPNPATPPAATPGQAIAGLFLILSGGCLTLLGGGCTILTLSWLFTPGGGALDTLELAAIALLMLGAGIGLIWNGRNLMRGNPNNQR